MGIQGLLPQLKSIMLPIHIKDLKGCSVAIDTYSWLHKGALSCSTDLCKGIPTSRHIEYCMHRVNLLRHFGVKPILVFDGGLLPMKSEQENKRARVRKDNLARAIEHESNGNSAAAYECYQKAVDISPQIARELIQVLKRENVQYIVAPYEADAQMTYLAISRQVDAVITEDSDLIPFGCPRIIFKMDKFGQGVQFQYSMLQKNKELSFEGFNRQMLLEMCILSGCDYLQSLPGMGLKKAHASIKRFKSYDKALKHLRYSGVSVPPYYEESFRKAILTFQYQRVYDPVSENIVHLSNVPDDIGGELDFLGPPLPKDIAQGIAEGDLDPITKMPFEIKNLVTRSEVAGACQFKTFHSEREERRIDLPVQKNLLTKYFCFASLEAKRNFRAPRTSPTIVNQSTLISSSASSLEHETLEAAASETKNSGASTVDSDNCGSVPLLNSYTKNSFSTKTSELIESPCHVSMAGEKRSTEHTILRQPRQSIHKPCLGLHKEHEQTNVHDKVEGKTKEAKGKVIVRSPYFQHKQVENNACDEKQDRLSSGIVIDERKNAISDDGICNNHLKNTDLKRKISPSDSIQYEHEHTNVQDKVEAKTKETKGKVIVRRSPYFQHKQVENNVFDEKQDWLPSGIVINERKNAISGDDLCNNDLRNIDLKRKVSPNDSIQNEHEHTNVHDKFLGTIKEEKRKVIVRSPYFQHKQVEKNACDEKHDQPSSCTVIDERENDIPDDDLCNNHMKKTDLKRKVSPNDSIRSETFQPRQMYPTSSTHNNGLCDYNVDGPSAENSAEEEKFGTNISHLGKYSEIAEKSLERFTSLMSSFRYTSGSRVSGLRAPLKEVHNIRNNRPTAVNLSQYAYVPKQAKTRRIAPDIHKTSNDRPTAVDFSQFAYVPKETKTRRIAPGN